MTTAVDLNDPSTWPDDIAALEEMAKAGLPAADAEPPTPAEPEKKEPKAEEPKAEEPKPAEPPKAEPPKEDPPKAEPPKAEAPKDEELPISTKDGKRTIPYNVLRSERDARREAEERLKALEAELETARKQTAAPAPKEEKPAELPGDVQAKAEKLRQDWGDAIAEQYLELEASKQRQSALEAELKSLREQAQATATRQQRSEEEQVQDAIDRSPQMVEWQSDDKGPWFQRAVQMNSILMETDSEYRAMSWEERFQSLPDRVLAAYGQAKPAPAAQEPKQDTPKEDPAKVLAEAAKKAAEAPPSVPKSMSEIPKGETPAEKDEVTRLEEMSPAEVQAYINRLAKDPAKLEAYLKQLM